MPNSIKNNLFIITTTLNEERDISSHMNYLNGLYLRYGIRYIVVDGGSNDNTPLILKSKCKKNRIILLNKGTIYHSWNKGIKYVDNAAYVCFLGVGDRISESYIQGVLTNIKYCRYDVIFSNLCISNKKQKIMPKIDSSIVNWTKLPFPHSGSFFNSSLFNKIGDFDEDYQIAGDLEWMLRLNSISRVKKNIVKYKYVDKGCVCMRPDGISTGRSKFISVLISETIKAHFLHKTPISIKRVVYFIIVYVRSKFK